ncbi:MAG: Gfo/Idh/MocA family protein [Candidatus Cyclobacteriaceae bacterium M3_2C_046]
MSNISRRNFIGKSLAGFAGVAIAPNLYGLHRSANETIRLGFIGMGRQSMFLLNGFIQLPGVEVVAGCDVYEVKRKRFENRVNEHNAKTNKKVKVQTYEKYQDLLARQDVDAVVVATPDHWHALIAIDAVNAGKDVYLEKPLTFTILEGQKLRLAVRDNNRILGVGSQQRSDPNFQHAVNLVQDGKIGRIQKVNAYVGAPPTPYNLPQEPMPKGLNWDLWLGPNPYVHYNHELNPPISLNPPKDEDLWGAWRWYKEMGGGFTTDWGAHMFDIAQWGLNMDNSGPMEIIPAGYKDTPHLTYIYNNGAVMTEEPFDAQKTKGVKFWGNDGWIEISRGHYKASDPSLMPPKSASSDDGPYETRIPHQINFIEAVRNRKDPVVPVEIGHRSCTVCNLGNIAYELGRPVRWDATSESFVNDPEADKHFHRNYRDGYSV